MKKFYLFATVLAGMTLASCSSEDELIEAPPVNQETVDVPIMFSSTRGNITRADITGADAADLLGNKFVVSGYKGQSTAAVGNIVFDNYLVEYEENTAYTTESNTRNWEYVGKGRIKHAIDNGITNQTIKYWDYSALQYDFIAWSTGKNVEAIYDGTPEEGQVLVSAITPQTAIGDATDEETGADVVAYTMEGKADDLRECYVADIVTVKKKDYSKDTGENPVVIRFRSLGTKVRIGIYETVPGYSVRDVKFYTQDGVLTNVDEQIVDQAVLFSAGSDIYTEGKYTIYFPTVDDEENSDNNMAHIKFSPKENVEQTTLVEWGSMNYTIAEDGEKTPGSVYLGRSSNTATFAGDADKNYYVTYLPNETGTNLNRRVDFVLESTDGSGEVINVKNAKAQVPLIYTTWKPGYAYTYLFKISDKTNGRTGNYDPTLPDDNEYNSDPAGLFPITFDAVVMNSEEDATQETITTISTPSITTYQKGSKVVDNNEYLAATGDIFVTVNENDELVTLQTTEGEEGEEQTTTTKAALYTIPDGKTEAEVIDALSIQDDDAEDGTIKGRSGLVLTEADFTLVDKIEYGADGNIIELDDLQAMRFTPEAGTYAFVYMKTASTEETDYFEPVTKAKGDDVTGLYRYGLKNAPAGDVKEGVKYFRGKAYDMETVFLGQVVNNMYLDENGTIAKGHAVTGTTYYYTTNHGMSYKAAKEIAYAEFGGLYVLKEKEDVPGEFEYVLSEDETPQEGTAYYFKEDDGSYTYCVIYPQQTNADPKLMVFKKDKVACDEGETAKNGMVYFDKFTKNNGEYYTKVIKVQ